MSKEIRAFQVSRSLGALLGVHAGDSLGATLEFQNYHQIKKKYPDGLREIIGGGGFRWPAGHATDDTDLTRAAVLAYVDRKKARTTGGKHAHDFDVVRSTADHCVDWLYGSWPGRKPGSAPVDIGNATQVGLQLYQKTGDPRRAGAGRDQAGNGSLMRCIPTALFAESRDKRVMESWEISAITHNDFRCRAACMVYNEIVAALIDGKTVEAAIREGKRVIEEWDAPILDEAIERGRRLDLKMLAEKGPGSEHSDLTRGYVLSAFTLSIAALFDGRSFEDVVVDVTRLGGDTDTNGAIVGGMLGAKVGIEGIPDRWVRKLQFRDEFEAAVRYLV
ncbi:ADP-ribosylglycohydrolase family protein [Aaosphaeria arxii CBS 175.79]|uniref:ADP-ribosylhydrolase ARH3 n=1 Tax=Aaosphaeria arxii CBS 175.79 TaxID=1450172 RepID=A0A6A5XCX8_9PLEO|nr:ADP-ribosylglycohydrolase family protein [Aaosphaeria arxii CBS 175.79]KAF2010723.1 ADP-ribosylglycohydrolase family protein [Aaosphaeria arxii CBS 175.79]